MTRLITYILIVLGVAMLAGCDSREGGYKLPHSLAYTYDNGTVIEILNNSKIEVTEKPDAFDLCFASNGIFKEISIRSSNPQCSAEIISGPDAKYDENGRFACYTQIVHIDMREEKSIGLTVKFHETKYRKDNSISFSLIRKENQQ